jgi:hypothetical protein
VRLERQLRSSGNGYGSPHSSPGRDQMSSTTTSPTQDSQTFLRAPQATTKHPPCISPFIIYHHQQLVIAQSKMAASSNSAALLGIGGVGPVQRHRSRREYLGLHRATVPCQQSVSSFEPRGVCEVAHQRALAPLAFQPSRPRRPEPSRFPLFRPRFRTSFLSSSPVPRLFKRPLSPGSQLQCGKRSAWHCVHPIGNFTDRPALLCIKERCRRCTHLGWAQPP